MSKTTSENLDAYMVQLARQRELIEHRENELIDVMENHGGHFAHHLARAWACADAENRAKLRAAFGALLCSYEWALRPLSN